jgi:hypothetical protein
MSVRIVADIRLANFGNTRRVIVGSVNTSATLAAKRIRF